MWESRKCWACRYRGQTHPYIHILKGALMLTATIKSVIYTGLGPLAMLLEECEQWCRLLQAIKQGGGNCRVKVETPRVQKQLPPSSNPEFTSLLLSVSHRCLRSSSTAFLKMWSHHRFVTFVNLTDLENNNWLLSLILLVLAGCNSNSMWKLCRFQWKCCYLQRATEHNAENVDPVSKRFGGFFCVCLFVPGVISLDLMKNPDGAQGDDLWIDSQ